MQRKFFLYVRNALNITKVILNFLLYNQNTITEIENQTNNRRKK